MKRRAFVAAGIFILLSIWSASYVLGLFRATPTLAQSSDIPNQVVLNLATQSNFRQGPNQCGPYAAAAFLSAATTDLIRPEEMVQELPWKLPGGYTHPRALESLIEKQGTDVRAYNARSLSHEEKIQFLHQRLTAHSPVILLTYMYDYQHYITLLGYDATKEIFYVYDPVFTRGESGMTTDENGALPGNRTIPNEQLLVDWAGGGIAGFYTWYALAITE